MFDELGSNVWRDAVKAVTHSPDAGIESSAGSGPCRIIADSIRHPGLAPYKSIAIPNGDSEN
jgi:hypothetical protein